MNRDKIDQIDGWIHTATTIKTERDGYLKKQKAVLLACIMKISVSKMGLNPEITIWFPLT